jgi:PAS domain S-box-containing protein
MAAGLGMTEESPYSEDLFVKTSDRNTLNQSSRQLELKFRSLADNSPDMIVRYDLSLRRTYVNLAWEKSTGIAAETALNHSPAELPGLMTKAKSSEYEDKLLTALETGEPVNMEISLHRADGTEIHLERRIVPEFDVDGKLVSLFSISRDITERKNNEDMLRIAAAAFETHEAIVITDVNVQIIRVNQAFHDITGYAAEDVIGQNPSMLSSGRHNKSFYEQMWQSIIGKGSWTGEVWDKRKNGEVYPKWLTITADRVIQPSMSAFSAM